MKKVVCFCSCCCGWREELSSVWGWLDSCCHQAVLRPYSGFSIHSLQIIFFLLSSLSLDGWMDFGSLVLSFGAFFSERERERGGGAALSSVEANTDFLFL
ncbi:hypothetical protein Dimus_031334 [Dionaea muscipula]